MLLFSECCRDKVTGADGDTSQIITLLTGTKWESRKHEIKVLLLHYGAWEFIKKPDEGEIEKSLAKMKETAPGVTM